MIYQAFKKLVCKYQINEVIIETLWNEIEKFYSEKNRHYHNLSHIENLISELESVKHLIKDSDTIMFSTFYHDIVYNTLKQNNEEKSAELAEKRLTSLGLANEKILKCKAQILATKTHILNPDSDTNLFTDADLSILGKDWNVYSDYFKNIRKEYHFYPDLIYYPGRKKVLKHFLEMERIFKTDAFYENYEKQARENILKELENE